MNPRKRKQRIREALARAAEEAAQTKTKEDDQLVEAATLRAKEKGILTEAEAEEIVSKLKPAPVKTLKKTVIPKNKIITKPKTTKEKKVGEEEQTTTKRTKKAKESTTKRRKKRTTKRTTKSKD